MKILKVFGIVVGIHVFALILIFANPGCSATTKPQPASADTAAPAAATPSPAITAAPPPPPASADPVTSGANFDPNAQAIVAPPAAGPRYVPTRPTTAAATALVAEPVRDTTPTTMYTVKSGDSLWTIAKKNHVTVADLAKANNLKTNTVLHNDQKLLIPGKAPAPSVSSSATTTTAANPVTSKTSDAALGGTPAPASNETVKHVVKSGDTIGSIAHTYGVSQSAIEVANHITDPKKLPLGKELIIPGWQPPKGKAAKSSSGSTTSTASRSTPPPTVTPSAQPAPGPGSTFNIPTLNPAPDNSQISPAPPPPGSSDVPVVPVEPARKP